MVQVKNGNKAGNNDCYKRERGHERGHQIQLKKGSNALEKGIRDFRDREGLRGSWEGLKHVGGPQMQLRGPQMRLRGPQRQLREHQRQLTKP